MGMRISGLLLLALLAIALAGCGGKSAPAPDPGPDFTHMTAQVLGNDGTPLSGLSVRVEGQDTGVTTNGSGQFTLDAAAFPNGVEATNEIALGRNGVVIGSREVVPATDPDVTIRFEDANGGTGTAVVSGVVKDSFTGNTLAGVQVSLFSVDGGVFQQDSDSSGAFSFTGVGAGSWQLIGFLKDYLPEMAFLAIEDGQTIDYTMQLDPSGQPRPGEGIKITGKLTDSKTGAPIAGAFVSAMADTGYMGIPEMGIYDDIKTDPATGVTNSSGGGQSSPGSPGMEPAPDMPPTPGGSGFAPWRYDPQYQETTTAADGTFSFDKEVVGYSVWFSFSKDGYLSGSHYESIDGRTDDLDVALTLDPIIPTDISGRVVDGNGDPVEGAYVEFIFSGSVGGGPMPMDYAVPPTMDLGGMAADGTESRNNTGAPPPPPVMGAPGGTGAGQGWDDWANSESDAATGAGGVPPAAPGGADSAPGGAPNFDNSMMQKFRWEQEHNHGASDVDPGFTGYYSATTGADGTFNFTGAPAGPYYIFASAYRHQAWSGEFTAQEDPASNTIDIVCPDIPVGSVDGVVTDENGDPVTDVLVNATQPYVDPFTYTDTSGHFRIDNVPAGQWIISGYKEGYLTMSVDTAITDGGVAHVNLQLTTYTPPEATVIPFNGRIFDGSKGWDENGQPSADAGISGAEIVFTPVDNNYGSYVQHVQSGTGGSYGANLVNQLDYNLLVQASGYQDLFTRIWVDEGWPQLDFSLWPIGGPNGGGGGIIVSPGPGKPTDPSTGGPGSDPGNGGGGTTPPPSNGGGDDPVPM